VLLVVFRFAEHDELAEHGAENDGAEREEEDGEEAGSAEQRAGDGVDDLDGDADGDGVSDNDGFGAENGVTYWTSKINTGGAVQYVTFGVFNNGNNAKDMTQKYYVRCIRDVELQ
jgi:hypothetical protein